MPLRSEILERYFEWQGQDEPVHMSRSNTVRSIADHRLNTDPQSPFAMLGVPVVKNALNSLDRSSDTGSFYALNQVKPQ